MNIGSLLTDIAKGFASFVPELAKGIWTGFSGLFLVTGTGADAGITGFNVLGMLGIATLCISLAFKTLPMITNFLISRSSARRSRKTKA